MKPTTVKALVIRSPYAQQIAAGAKAVENRSWRTHYRGWLAIVAARRRDSGADAGRVVCVVRLTDCVEAGHRDHEWLLADPRPLTERVELPGRLGLYDMTGQLPASVLALTSPRPATRPVRRREIHQFLGRD